MIVRGNKGKTHFWRAFETLAMLLRMQAMELAKLIRHFCVGRSCQSNRTTFAGFRAEFGTRSYCCKPDWLAKQYRCCVVRRRLAHTTPIYVVNWATHSCVSVATRRQ